MNTPSNPGARAAARAPTRAGSERSPRAARWPAPSAAAALTLLCLLAVWLWPSTLHAQQSQSTVRLDGRVLFRVGEASGLDAVARRDQIERRLGAVLDNPSAIRPATIEASGAGHAEREVAVAGRPVVTVTALDASATGASVDALATQWKLAIDQGLAEAASRRGSTGKRFISEVRASVETAFSRLLESTIEVVPRALAALLVIAAFWALATAVRWLMRLVFRRFVSDLTVENLIRQVAYYSVWALGLIVAANAFGLAPQTLVTGLGLTSLALGFALKDILSNFVSGLLLLTLRPFRLGDEIVIGETEGTVERIELRATQMRTYDGRQVLVPNAEVFTSRVTNNTASPIRRGSVEVVLGYDADLREATDALAAAARSTAGVLAEPDVSIRLRELGGDAIVLEVRFWADSRRSDFLSTASLVRGQVLEAFKAAGIPLPEPHVRVVVTRQADASPRRAPGP